ncbi:MAG: hypothetical protein LBC93_00970 [Synergistaceae bacterium]|jgi:hypothetical protein|nr:hypothetical protein [Synergistaceae bacterium]
MKKNFRKTLTKTPRRGWFSAALVFALVWAVGFAEAHSSKAWKERLDARTATLWVEGQVLGEELVLNSRGVLQVTWLERGLTRRLGEDRDAEEWLVTNLSYYSSSRKETQAKLKGRDVFLLHYRALKRWDFDLTQVVIDGYRLTSDDVLTRKDYWKRELAPGSQSAVAIAAPSLKPGQKVEIRYDDALAEFKVPHR